MLPPVMRPPSWTFTTSTTTRIPSQLQDRLGLNRARHAAGQRLVLVQQQQQRGRATGTSAEPSASNQHAELVEVPRCFRAVLQSYAARDDALISAAAGLRHLQRPKLPEKQQQQEQHCNHQHTQLHQQLQQQQQAVQQDLDALSGHPVHRPHFQQLSQQAQQGEDEEQRQPAEQHYQASYREAWQQEQQGVEQVTPGDLTAAFVQLLKQHSAAKAARQLGLTGSSTTEAATAAVWDEQRWQQLVQSVQHLLPHLQPHQGSLIAYAAAKLGRPFAPQLLSTLLQQQLQQRQLQLLPAAGLTNMLWAVAVVSHSPSPHWMASFYAACSSRALAAFNHHQLTSILWCLGRLTERPPAEWLQLLLAALRPGLPLLSPSELANTLWGLAQLGYRPSKAWAKDWFMASNRIFGYCTPDHLACIAGSLGLLRLDPRSGHWLRQYRSELVRRLPAMRAAHVATVMCGLAKRCSSQPPHWVWLLVARQLQLLDEQRQRQQRTIAAAAGADADSAAAPRQMQLDEPLPQQQAAEAIANHSGSSTSKEGWLSSQCRTFIRSADIAATVWALPRLLYPTAAAWKSQPANAAQLKALAAASLPLLSACSAGELVQLAVGFAGLRFYPGAHWLKVHENAVAVQYRQLSAANKMRLRAAVRIMWSDG